MSRVKAALSVIALVFVSTSASSAAEFASVVETVLLKQKEIVDLDADRQREMISCVKQVLTEVPEAKQRYVAESANFDEMENRFGEVVLADRAEFKQKITKDCGGIAMAQ